MLVFLHNCELYLNSKIRKNFCFIYQICIQKPLRSCTFFSPHINDILVNFIETPEYLASGVVVYIYVCKSIKYIREMISRKGIGTMNPLIQFMHYLNKSFHLGCGGIKLKRFFIYIFGRRFYSLIIMSIIKIYTVCITSK